PEKPTEYPVEIAAGYGEACARMNTGAVICWGLNIGPLLIGIDTPFALPTRVPGLTALAIGLSTWGGMCTLTDAHEVRCRTPEAAADTMVPNTENSCALAVTTTLACVEK